MDTFTIPRTEDTCEVLEVDYQRNGISGEGFHVVRFRFQDHELLGVVFDEPKHVAVIDPTDLASHWRGDNFEAGLRQVYTTWERQR